MEHSVPQEVLLGSVVAEEGHGDGAGTHMGADGAADGIDGETGGLALVQAGTVRDVFAQQGVLQTGVGQSIGQVEVDAPALLHQIPQHIVAVFGASGFAQNGHLAVFDGDDRLDGQQRSGQSCGGGDASALFQVFQRIQQGDEADMLFGLVQQIGNFLCAFAGITGLQRQFHQNALTDRYI